MPVRAILLRFVVLYFGLYFLPFPVNALSSASALPPPVSWLGQAAAFLDTQVYERALDAASVWVGKNILGLGDGVVVIQPTGSGDTAAQFVRVAIFLFLAVAGTIAWTAVSRSQPPSPRLLAAFRVYVRYAMAMWLLAYGFAKVPPLQFQVPGPELLVRTYGDSSPMGLLWTFMGHSPAYTMFAGFAELIPGLLLLFRRTTLLGALIGAATMTNVGALNFMYDVPVKLFSAHLLAALVLIAAPDLWRLAKFFVLNQPVPAAQLRPHPRSRLSLVTKVAFVALLLTSNVVGAYQSYFRFGPGAPRTEFAGVYEIESFVADGEERPPLWTDTSRWRRLLVSHRGFLVVQPMGDKNERFSYKQDAQGQMLNLTGFGTSEVYTLKTRQDEDGALLLEGQFRERELRVKLRKQPATAFPLQTRGFRWVQELPYNR